MMQKKEEKFTTPSVKSMNEENENKLTSKPISLSIVPYSSPLGLQPFANIIPQREREDDLLLVNFMTGGHDTISQLAKPLDDGEPDIISLSDKPLDDGEPDIISLSDKPLDDGEPDIISLSDKPLDDGEPDIISLSDKQLDELIKVLIKHRDNRFGPQNKHLSDNLNPFESGAVSWFPFYSSPRP